MITRINELITHFKSTKQCPYTPVVGDCGIVGATFVKTALASWLPLAGCHSMVEF